MVFSFFSIYLLDLIYRFYRIVAKKSLKVSQKYCKNI